MLLSAHALLLTAHLAAAIFFHEKSAVDLKSELNTSAYGYSLGYQSGDAKLVIGAPRYDIKGKVYQCSVQKIKDKKASCHDPVDIKFEKPLLYDRTLSPDQHFYLGASIAATTNGFVVCAPLRTLLIDIEHETTKYGAFGVCFAYHNGTAKVWNLHSEYASVIGGAGWSSLSDERNERIIISRFFKKMDAVYTQMSNPESYTSCLKQNSSIVSLTDVTIYGQAMSMGNYFDKNRTTYAFSMNTVQNHGHIDFISSDPSDLAAIWTFEYRLSDSSVGTMFGAALCSADVTGDGLTELIVGAPTQVLGASYHDTGAVHVYTSNSSNTEMTLTLTIWGVANGARFGSVLSTNDVNGDSYPEIIVSAPYEKSGGVLYIICGFALYTNKRATISVLELARTQKIERSQSFGFSLQPVADYNENGSDELAVGAPETSTVTMYQGVPAITANVTSEFRNYATDTNTEFSFSSCVTIEKPEKPKEITTRLLVENVLRGENAVFKNGEDATYEISLDKPTNISGNLYQYCKDLTIESPLSCKVNTTVSLKGNIDHDPEFKNTWVTLSPQSRLTKETQPQCNCNGVPCTPLYSVELRWAGRSGRYYNTWVTLSPQSRLTKETQPQCNYNGVPCTPFYSVELRWAGRSGRYYNTWVTLSPLSRLTKETQPQCNCNGVPCTPLYSVELRWAGRSGSDHRYVVGSSDQETVTIVVHNSGTMGCGACAVVRVRGALKHSLPCKQEGGYRCELPTPFRAATNKTIDVELFTNTLSNQEKSLTIDVEVRKECAKPEAIKDSFSLTYDFSNVLENVIIIGSTINSAISDRELNDMNEEKLSVEQTFTIFNNQSFKWSNVLVTLDTDNKPYIENSKLRMRQSMKSCNSSTDSSNHHWKCSINLASNSTTEITVATTIYKKEIKRHLQSSTVKIESKLRIELTPDEFKDEAISTLITLEQEVKEKSPAVTIIIAVAVALLVLLVIAFILYKLNFFKRKDKEELEELKKEIRNRSLRSATTSEAQPVSNTASEIPKPELDFDMVDLYVDETPLKSALSSQQLNSIAASLESTKMECKKQDDESI